MTWETYLLYLATVAVFFATPPGTSQILIMSNGLRYGLRPSLATMSGDLSANALQMLAAGFGLVTLIATSASALTIIKWLGVAYLAWFAIRIFFAAPPDLSRQAAPVSSRALFAQGFFTSAANPEAVFFFAALFPQFIDPTLAIWPQLLVLGGTYLLVDGAILIAMAAGAERLQGWFTGRGRLLNRVAGAMMGAAAVALAVRDVHAR